MKNILLFIIPFLVFGLLSGVFALFGRDAVFLILYTFIIIVCLSFMGAMLVANFGD